jgi:hypothetical protein
LQRNCPRRITKTTADCAAYSNHMRPQLNVSVR